MMEEIRITLVQQNLVWEDIEANLARFTSHLKMIKPGDSDLVILPEMFTTGFSMNAGLLAEPMEGKTMNWMAKLAAEKNCAITGSLIIKEKNLYFNRLIWMKPNGLFECYDKRHLFKLGDEQITYTKGNKKLITSIKGWKIMPLICYDLRFPAWCRNSSPPGDSGAFHYDLLLFVANWPDTRIHHWKQLLVARAIENQCYVAGVNWVGTDGEGAKHSGYSMLINYQGEIVSNIKPFEEFVQTYALSHDNLKEYRKNFPFLSDRDDFSINDIRN
jgi:predicted amidohydrolase